MVDSHVRPLNRAALAVGVSVSTLLLVLAWWLWSNTFGMALGKIVVQIGLPEGCRLTSPAPFSGGETGCIVYLPPGKQELTFDCGGTTHKVEATVGTSEEYWSIDPRKQHRLPSAE